MIHRVFLWLAVIHGGKKTVNEVCRELHSFVIGWAEMFTFRIPPVVKITKSSLDDIKNEWHYYQGGRAAGVISWVIILGVLL